MILRPDSDMGQKWNVVAEEWVDFTNEEPASYDAGGIGTTNAISLDTTPTVNNIRNCVNFFFPDDYDGRVTEVRVYAYGAQGEVSVRTRTKNEKDAGLIGDLVGEAQALGVAEWLTFPVSPAVAADELYVRLKATSGTFANVNVDDIQATYHHPAKPGVLFLL